MSSIAARNRRMATSPWSSRPFARAGVASANSPPAPMVAPTAAPLAKRERRVVAPSAWFAGCSMISSFCTMEQRSTCLPPQAEVPSKPARLAVPALPTGLSESPSERGLSQPLYEEGPAVKGAVLGTLLRDRESVDGSEHRSALYRLLCRGQGRMGMTCSSQAWQLPAAAPAGSRNPAIGLLTDAARGRWAP